MKKIVTSLSLVAALAVGMNGNETATAGTDNGGLFGWLKKSTYSAETIKTQETLNDVVSKIADQLNAKKSMLDDRNIAITSFVELNHLNKTTNFGRIIGESFYNELYSRGFNVMDFRVQKQLSVNANGEFYLSRDVEKLNDVVESDYVLVGTYSQIEEGVLINTRIVDSKNGKVVASSRVVYNDKSCEIFETCKEKVAPVQPQVKIVEVEKVVYVKPEPREPHKIKLTTDGCAKEVCPTNCPTGVCTSK